MNIFLLTCQYSVFFFSFSTPQVNMPPTDSKNMHTMYLMVASSLLALVTAQGGVEPTAPPPPTAPITIPGQDLAPGYEADYLPVVQAIVDVIENQEPGFRPLLVRLAWHSCSTFNPAALPVGGSTGGCVRGAPEADLHDNKGLDKATGPLEKVKSKFPYVSYADLYQLAGNTAMEYMGTPPLYFRPGRTDFTNKDMSTKCVADPMRLPQKNIDNEDAPHRETQKYFYEKFEELGFSLDTDPDALYKITALMGAHTFGTMHNETSNNQGNWTLANLEWSTEFYTNLMDGPWFSGHAAERNGTDLQYRGGPRPGFVMLPIDFQMRRDVRIAAICDEFKVDLEKFEKYFLPAWRQLQENGVVWPTDPPATTAPQGTTDAPATDAPTTEAPATTVPDTDAPAVVAPDTDTPATDAPDTTAPVTEAPMTGAPATTAPVTDAPPTDAPDTVTPTSTPTSAPATDAPPTAAPPTAHPGIDATNAPATGVPDTDAPATTAPATTAPMTDAPATAAPATDAPSTAAPSTTAPKTDAPLTQAPQTGAPATGAPDTTAPLTQAPATDAPETSAPPTAHPGIPATNAPATSTPTSAPSTMAPDTAVPTSAPVTDAPATGAPPTAHPGIPATDAPATSVPTSAPSTAAPATDIPMTEAPATDAPATMSPRTAYPGIAATDAPATDAPATDAPTTTAPRTAYPGIPETTSPETETPPVREGGAASSESDGSDTGAGFPYWSLGIAGGAVALCVAGAAVHMAMKGGPRLHVQDLFDDEMSVNLDDHHNNNQNVAEVRL